MKLKSDGRGYVNLGFICQPTVSQQNEHTSQCLSKTKLLFVALLACLKSMQINIHQH